jgi:hypothetical protein
MLKVPASRGNDPAHARLLPDPARVSGHLEARKQIRVACHAAGLGFADAVCPVRTCKGRPLLHELPPDHHLAVYTALESLRDALARFQIQSALPGDAVADRLKIEVRDIVCKRHSQLHDERDRRNGDHHWNAPHGRSFM